MTKNKPNQKVISFHDAKDRPGGTPTKEIVEWLEHGLDNISEKTDHKIRAHYLQRQFHVEGKAPKEEHSDGRPSGIWVYRKNHCHRNKE